MIQNLFNMSFEVADVSRPLLKLFQEQGIDWMHACGGKGRCTTCKVIVVAGESNFLERTVAEKKYLAEGALRADERLACQAKIQGDVTVVVPREYQLPHMRYSE